MTIHTPDNLKEYYGGEAPKKESTTNHNPYMGIGITMTFIGGFIIALTNGNPNTFMGVLMALLFLTGFGFIVVGKSATTNQKLEQETNAENERQTRSFNEYVSIYNTNDITQEDLKGYKEVFEDIPYLTDQVNFHKETLIKLKTEYDLTPTPETRTKITNLVQMINKENAHLKYVKSHISKLEFEEQSEKNDKIATAAMFGIGAACVGKYIYDENKREKERTDREKLAKEIAIQLKKKGA